VLTVFYKLETLKLSLFERSETIRIDLVNSNSKFEYLAKITNVFV